jgi:hypothetical protein
MRPRPHLAHDGHDPECHHEVAGSRQQAAPDARRHLATQTEPTVNPLYTDRLGSTWSVEGWARRAHASGRRRRSHSLAARQETPAGRKPTGVPQEERRPGPRRTLRCSATNRPTSGSPFGPATMLTESSLSRLTGAGRGFLLRDPGRRSSCWTGCRVHQHCEARCSSSEGLMLPAPPA